MLGLFFKVLLLLLLLLLGVFFRDREFVLFPACNPGSFVDFMLLLLLVFLKGIRCGDGEASRETGE